MKINNICNKPLKNKMKMRMINNKIRMIKMMKMIIIMMIMIKTNKNKLIHNKADNNLQYLMAEFQIQLVTQMKKV